jgi:hypothetical protein
MTYMVDRQQVHIYRLVAYLPMLKGMKPMLGSLALLVPSPPQAIPPAVLLASDDAIHLSGMNLQALRISL